MRPSILAVDDEPDMLRLLERVVKGKTPYQIDTVANSLKVPEILAARSYDVILIDLKMPGLDGMEILRMLKEQGRDEVAVVITAFGSLESAQEALSLGAFEYLTKPIRNETFIFALNRAIHWRKIKQEAHFLRHICSLESYVDAVTAFQREYVKTQADRFGDDSVLISRETGIPLESVEKILRNGKENK